MGLNCKDQCMWRKDSKHPESQGLIGCSYYTSVSKSSEKAQIWDSVHNHHLRFINIKEDLIPHSEKWLTSCKQQGKKHDEHLRGLSSLITSWPRLSIIFIVKGRAGPQQFLVQQSVSSAAKYTLCPNEFLISYLLFDSNPIKTEKSNRTVSSWGASAWTTNNKSTKLTLTYCSEKPHLETIRGSSDRGSSGEGPSSRAAQQKFKKDKHYEHGDIERLWRRPSVPLPPVTGACCKSKHYHS